MSSNQTVRQFSIDEYKLDSDRDTATSFLKHNIIQLQQQNASLKAEIVYLKTQHAINSENQIEQTTQRLSQQIAKLRDENANLNSILSTQELQIDQMKQLIFAKNEEFCRLEQQMEQLTVINANTQCQKQQILKLFKKFQCKQVYQMVRDMHHCQQLLCSNVKSLIQKQQQASDKYYTFCRQYQQDLRQLLGNLHQQKEEREIHHKMENQMAVFYNDLLQQRNIKNKQQVITNMGLINMEENELSVLDETHNIYRRRINRLKLMVVRLINCLKGVMTVKDQIREMRQYVGGLAKTLHQKYEDMFQKAVDTIGRYRENQVPKVKKQKKGMKN